MTETLRYKEKWEDPRFNKLFVGFKQFISASEQECARQCAKIIAEQIPYPNVRILDLGAGDGIVSFAFMETFSNYKPISSYTMVDISKELVTILQSKEKTFKKYSEELHFVCSDASEFTPATDYHLIVAFNSWYGISFEEISRYLSLLTSGGLLAIVLSSRHSITIDLTIQFIEPVLSSEDLFNWLELNKADYQRYQIVNHSLTPDNFLYNGSINSEGELFFRYLLRRTAGSLEDIVPYLKQKPELYFKIPQDLALLKK